MRGLVMGRTGTGRRWTVLLLAAAAAVGLGTGPCHAPGPGDFGLVPEGFVRARARDYLRHATEVQARGSILNAIAHMERDRRDPSYHAPTGTVDVEDWAGTWYELDTLQDTRDFDGLYLLNALLGYEGHPYLTPALWERIRTSLREFKYWYTDATPDVPDPDDPDRFWDETFYWTENHQLLFHTIEYLMGQRHPDVCFTQRGFAPTGDCSGTVTRYVASLDETLEEPYEMTGAEHRERGREKILRWLDERWIGGFSEWLSNIYLQKDATPLLTLVEYAEDPEIRTRATIVLDMLLADMAAHTHRGALGTTAGRTAIKDGHRGPANDTWGIVRQLFDQPFEHGYASRGDPGATLFARARRYRLPRVIAEMAKDAGPTVTRTRQSYPVDETAVDILDPGDSTHPPGHPFEDTEPSFTFWWGLGAWTIFQVVPVTVANAERHDLWEISLLEPFAPLRDALGDPPNLGFAVFLAKAEWPATAVGLLKEANTYTYRTPDYLLSTAQDYRKGANAGQVRSWQATLSSEALVFTTHPMRIAPARQLPSVFLSQDEGEPGVWTGTASQPRSAQHENVGIHIYSPRYRSNPLGGLGIDFAEYEDFTHAWFPRDHFDHWEQVGDWTFGVEGDGYVALYSWRPTEWRDYAQAELDLLPPTPDGPVTRSFDLMATGGPDNVWIVEMGRAADWGSFEAFRDAVLGAEVVVTPRPNPEPRVRRTDLQVFDVVYDSPSQGQVEFGWEGPLVVGGEEVPIDGYPRIDNPWVHAARGADTVRFEGGPPELTLDWSAPARDVGLRGPGGRSPRAGAVVRELLRRLSEGTGS